MYSCLTIDNLYQRHLDNIDSTDVPFFNSGEIPNLTQLQDEIARVTSSTTQPLISRVLVRQSYDPDNWLHHFLQASELLESVNLVFEHTTGYQRDIYGIVQVLSTSYPHAFLKTITHYKKVYTPNSQKYDQSQLLPWHDILYILSPELLYEYTHHTT